MVDYIDVIKFFTALYRKAIFLKYISNFSKPQNFFCLSHWKSRRNWESRTVCFAEKSLKYQCYFKLFKHAKLILETVFIGCINMIASDSSQTKENINPSKFIGLWKFFIHIEWACHVYILVAWYNNW